MQELYTSLRMLLDKLEMYQPFVADIVNIRDYQEELAVAKFLSALKPDIASHVRRQILGRDTMPSLLIGTSMVHIDQFALVSFGRGCGRGYGTDVTPREAVVLVVTTENVITTVV